MAPEKPQTPQDLIAEQTGIDLNLIEHNLNLSYEERLEEHQSALNLTEALQAAGEKLNEKPKSTSPSSH